MSLPNFLLGIVNDLGIFALVTMSYGAIIRSFQPGPTKSSIVGLMFGAGAGLAMTNGVEYSPGVLIDPRAVMLTLAAPFGGPVAASVAASIASAVRIWIGGPSVVVGVLNICATAAVSIAVSQALFRQTKPSTVQQLLVLGIAATTPFLLILAAPVADPIRVFTDTIGPLFVATVASVVVLGRFLCRERKTVSYGRMLEAEAFIDPLTELPNRRKLERKSTSIIENARRSGKPVSVLVIDIDRFKSMNDRFGHDVGDVLLKDVADVVLANVREHDALARYGGEEIVVVMPETGLPAASAVADRIRSLVDRDVFHGDRESGNVTVSVGVAAHQGDGVSFKKLFKAADEALYLAKERGRNRVELATPLTVPNYETSKVRQS